MASFRGPCRSKSSSSSCYEREAGAVTEEVARIARSSMRAPRSTGPWRVLREKPSRRRGGSRYGLRASRPLGVPPAAAACVVTVVVAVPCEFDHRVPGTFHVSAIHPPFDGDEAKPAHPILAELHERRFNQIQSLAVPQLRVNDPPSTQNAHLASSRLRAEVVSRTARSIVTDLSRSLGYPTPQVSYGPVVCQRAKDRPLRPRLSGERRVRPSVPTARRSSEG
jgi:hypothetical protein